MPLIIHKSDVSPPSRAVLMVVDILGLEAKTREVNLPTRDQFKPDYIKKNPLHTVPLLEDGDLVLADSHAINAYLVSAYGTDEQTKLYPTNVVSRAIVDQRLYFDATILFPRLRSVIYGVVKNRKRLTEDQENEIYEAYSITEKYLEVTPYMAANHLTLADISCGATLSALDCIIPIDKKYVKINDWWNRLKNESWYKKENEPGLKLFDGFIKQFL